MAGMTKQSWSRPLVALGVAMQVLMGRLLAQDPAIQVEVDANGGGGAWYTAWWVWVLIGLFVLVIVVALTSRGKSTA